MIENEKDDARNCTAARTDEIHPRTEELAEFLEKTTLPPSQRVTRASRRSSPAAARGGKTGWEGESC